MLKTCYVHRRPVYSVTKSANSCISRANRKKWIRPLNSIKHIIQCFNQYYSGVSKNNGTPKSSILIGFSIINHPFWDTPIFGNIHSNQWLSILSGAIVISLSLRWNLPIKQSQRNCYVPGLLSLTTMNNWEFLKFTLAGNFHHREHPNEKIWLLEPVDKPQPAWHQLTQRCSQARGSSGRSSTRQFLVDWASKTSFRE